MNDARPLTTHAKLHLLAYLPQTYSLFECRCVCSTYQNSFEIRAADFQQKALTAIALAEATEFQLQCTCLQGVRVYYLDES